MDRFVLKRPAAKQPGVDSSSVALLATTASNRGTLHTSSRDCSSVELPAVSIHSALDTIGQCKNWLSGLSPDVIEDEPALKKLEGALAVLVFPLGKTPEQRDVKKLCKPRGVKQTLHGKSRAIQQLIDELGAKAVGECKRMRITIAPAVSGPSVVAWSYFDVSEQHENLMSLASWRVQVREVYKWALLRKL